MTTREEIKNFLKDGLGNVWADGRDGKHINLDDCAKSIVRYLHSQDVRIIKKENDGIVAVEPLVEDVQHS